MEYSLISSSKERILSKKKEGARNDGPVIKPVLQGARAKSSRRSAGRHAADNKVSSAAVDNTSRIIASSSIPQDAGPNSSRSEQKLTARGL